MNIEETYLKGCFVISPKVISDDRGLFFESFNKIQFEKQTGVKTEFVQDNQSISKKGVLRGLHLQIGKFSQAKLVRAVKGKVLDVCVDLRKESDTFGKHFSIILSDQNNKQVFIPKGFAHGFLTLSDSATFSYKCDTYYNKNSERGIYYNDPDLNINWGFPESNIILSNKDNILPSLSEFLNEK